MGSGDVLRDDGACGALAFTVARIQQLLSRGISRPDQVGDYLNRILKEMGATDTLKEEEEATAISQFLKFRLVPTNQSNLILMPTNIMNF